jgi:glucokinase
MKEIICVDLGGTKTRCAVFDVSSSIPREVTIIPTPRHKMGEEVLDNILKSIRVHFKGVNTTVAIVMGAPGPLDVENGIVIDAPLFQNFRNIPLLDIIRTEFNVHTFVQNDANLAALGEYKYGAGVGSNTMIYITVSTGIGGGIVINDQLLTGSRGFASEPGHICIYPEGNLCGCGRRGCLEAYASGSAIESDAYRIVNQGVETDLLSVFNEKGKISVEDVVKHAQAGDEIAISILKDAGNYIGLGLSSMVNILNPDKIIIGGGVSNAGDLLLDAIKKTIANQALFPLSDQVAISKWAIGDEAGLRGAYAYGLQRLENEI